MKPKVPKSIRERVIKQWLQGTSRDQIAKDNGIGSGTVRTIVNEYRQNDSGFDLVGAFLHSILFPQ